MVSKKEGKYVIWQHYFDYSYPRALRKVPKKLAVKEPDIKKIADCAKALGLEPIVEEARYPKFWWKKNYRVIVAKKWKKTELLRKMGEKLIEFY
ncbi:MAG: signal recognition particle subunit SRP19/SEC65 family protein [Candidatus Thermoplasmatota archaeon]|nr:signal recognition particle subunit SRP19/SEC65 family protein [Candidatus Thermoplasmatota archaeon]